MPFITYDDFAGGLDVRPAAQLARANILRVLKNAYVTTGKSIKKRPCLSFEATLEAGTIGLKAFGGKLNTFYGTGAAITHADTRFVARRVPHWTSGVTPTKIHFCDKYSALMYVVAEYTGVYRHHYLDDPGVWLAATAYAANIFRRPTVENGFRYEVTAGGGGNSGAGEPVWPTTIGATVVDNALTWTCRTFAITDTNCPHTKETTKAAEKIYAKGLVDGTTVRYCKTGDPRDWTTASDAGFLPAGNRSTGSDQVTALGPFKRSGLTVFFSDGTQVWQVDPDPANNELLENIEGVGTTYHRAAGPVSGDLFFLAQSGFRSVSVVSLTDNVQDSDVGSPIDALVKAQIMASDDPQGMYYPKLGQFWCINGATAWVYTFSRTSKLSAWSQFTLPFTIDDATVLNQELYVRVGNDVYRVSDSVYKDGTSSIPLVDVLMFYQDGKKPGVTKTFNGVKFIGTGQPTISYLFAAENQGLESQAYELPEVSVMGEVHPVELLAERIAPHLQHQKDEAFEISQLMLLYENLGVV